MTKNLLVEKYVTAIRLQGGYNSKLPITTSGNLTVTGTTSLAATSQTGAETVTSNSANASAVGPNGTTNPSFNVDASTASAATGLNVKSAAAAGGLAVSVISSGTDENLTIDAKGAGTITLAGTSTGNINLNHPTVLTSNSATAFIVGPNGATNPALKVDASASSSVTGIKVVSKGSGVGAFIGVISSATNEGLHLNAQNAGAVIIGEISTGQVSIGRGAVKPPILSSTIASLGTAQNSTPTAAQLVGGIVTQTSSTGAGTVTLDTGTNISAAVPGVAVGDTFQCIFANLGGGQTLTITSATGATVVGNGAVATGKNAILTFVNTGANAWNVYVNVSA